jgi:3-deoxy-D-manno-octulosonic-acid transferase
MQKNGMNFVLKPSLLKNQQVVHLHSCSYGERKKLEPSVKKGMQSIAVSMDTNIEDKHEEEHEDSKKERKIRTTN